MWNWGEVLNKFDSVQFLGVNLYISWLGLGAPKKIYGVLPNKKISEVAAKKMYGVVVPGGQFATVADNHCFLQPELGGCQA